MTLLDSLLNPDHQIILYADAGNHAERGGPKVFEQAKTSGILHQAGDLPLRRAYELPSGHCSEYFISFWELFGISTVYTDCIVEFKEHLDRLREVKETSFDVIATCTQTGKYLVSGIAALMTGIEEDVNILHLDYTPSADNSVFNPDLSDRRVLLITDVVSSGQQVQNLARFIHKLGGMPVVVLAGVITSIEIKDADSIPWQNGTREELPLVALARLGIPYFAPPVNADGSKAYEGVRIDPHKIFPEEQPEQLPKHKRSLGQFLTDTEQSESLHFGLFSGDWHRMQVRIDIPTYLDKCGSVINDIFEETLTSSDFLVSPYSRAEQILKEHLQKNVRICSVPWLMLPRKSAPEGPENFFLLPRQIKQLRDLATISTVKVTVVLFSVQTAERLRDIVSLLAGYGVHDIHVITVVNRMTLVANSFVSRLAHFFRSTTDEHTSFTFTSIYTLHEYEPRCLLELEKRMRMVLAAYIDHSRNTNFTLDVRHDLKYLAAVSLASPLLKNRQPHACDRLSLGKSLLGSTVEGQLVDLYQRILQDQNYALLSEAISAITHSNVHAEMHREWLFRLFGIAVADVGYFCLTSACPTLSNLLWSEIERIRRIRSALPLVDLEANLGLLERECDLMTLLGLLSSFVADERRHDQVVWFLMEFPGEAPTKEDNIAHRWITYCNQRTYSSASFVLLSAYPDIRHEKRGDLRERLFDTLENIRRHLDGDMPDEVCRALAKLEGVPYPKPSKEIKEDYVRKGKDLVGMLEKEILPSSAQERFEIADFLLQNLVNPNLNHNPISRNIQNGIDSLQSHGKPGVRVTDEADKRRLEAAYQAAGVLRDIANVARSFSRWAISDPTYRAIYESRPPDHGMILLAGQLAESLSSIRRANYCKASEYRQLQSCWSSIRDHMATKSSVLCTALMAHLLSLRVYLDDALEKAQKTYGGNDSVWMEWRELLQERGIEHFITEHPETGEYLAHCEELAPATILCEPLLLQETLRNILSNARHIATSASGARKAGMRLVLSRRYLHIEREKIPSWYVALEWHPSGGTSRALDQSSTLAKHKSQIKKWAAQLILEEAKGHLSLEILARNQTGGIPARWL